MVKSIPKDLWDNPIANILESVKQRTRDLTNKGYIFGFICLDEDAKLIAVNKSVDKDINYFQLSIIGSIMYGTARQGKDTFNTGNIEYSINQYEDMQIVVRSICSITLKNKGLRDVIVVLLADKGVNLGMIICQLDSLAEKLQSYINKMKRIRKSLELDELRYKEVVNLFKREIAGMET